MRRLLCRLHGRLITRSNRLLHRRRPLGQCREIRRMARLGRSVLAGSEQQLFTILHVVDGMPTLLGWKYEGVVMCAPQ